ncbi:mitochondrial genome maintenance exonuclease 1 [Amia ocellicauda]|uniref:mitochondrial genome maintenance exonuclease 1 n=1 Tax=Amia ocellicauda TaxID=2972642 RepID=UPI003464B783
MRFYLLFNKVLHAKPLSSVLTVCLSTSCFWNTRKKPSQYDSVDTEKYSSLVRSVVSSRVSSQTPASLEQEDGHIYGPVIKSKHAAEKPVSKTLKNSVPLLNHAKVVDLSSEAGPMSPVSISLERGQDRMNSPSVTRILQQTMPPEQAFYLERWRKRMIAKLGEEGFKEYTANLFRQGKLFHSALEAILMSGAGPEEEEEKEEAADGVAGYIESVQHVLADISGVRAIESAVQHQSLQYVGLVDCVAQYRGKVCVIDWKTSEKPKPFLHNTFDNPLQVAAYIGAVNNDNNYGFLVEHGLIVVAYKDGSPAHPHFMDPVLCQSYWTKWLFRLEEYLEKN